MYLKGPGGFNSQGLITIRGYSELCQWCDISTFLLREFCMEGGMLAGLTNMTQFYMYTSLESRMSCC